MDAEAQKIYFCTFGMFIIDEIEWKTPNPQPTRYDLIGGAGTYAALGARLAVSPSRTLSSSVSWIIDMGSDFPAHLKTNIERWDTNCIFRRDQTRLTTRAWNGYGSNGWRDFKYLTAKKRLEVASLNHHQIMSRSFHMVCSPERCMDLTKSLQQRRAEIDSSEKWPVIIWEPIPDLCSPEELQNLHSAAHDCSIVSPNHDELKLFFPNAEDASQEDLVHRFMGWKTSGLNTSTVSAAVPVIREGSNGSTAYFRIATVYEDSCLVASEPAATEFFTVSIHIPAYHDSPMAQFVTDPTGGGNTYLGALAISMTDIHIRSFHPSLICIYEYLGWCEGNQPFVPDHTVHVPDAKMTTYNQMRSVLIAMIVANVAASFAIEQNGIPELDYSITNQAEDETWNGESFLQRLDLYLEREGHAIRKQTDHIKSLLRIDRSAASQLTPVRSAARGQSSRVKSRRGTNARTEHVCQ